ncbi:hypothetical protein [uncultured Aquimarina sp.]|uniref:hypothetical protein n=1 Tax=uncultured Aquimarina sp. TaxID=575652 RepID=UPI00262322BB|nr:hypothetical protein [uncultured Aquimarina sp.]
MERNDILKEILSDPDLMEKYDIQEKDLKELTTSPPYNKKIVEVLAVIINENDNHLNSSMIYKKIKKAHNIG